MIMVQLQDYLILAAVLFSVGMLGMVINKKNIINMLLCIELILLAANFNFIAFSQYLHHQLGEVFVFFVLAVAAAESVIGLAIILVLYRSKKTIAVAELDELRG